MSQASNQFYEGLQALHPDLDLTADDVLTFFEFYGQTLHEESQRRELALYQPNVKTNAIIYPVQNGRVVGIVAKTALGFLTGGYVGAAIALAGALYQEFTRKPDKRNQDDDNYGPNYGFDSGGDLAPVGGPIPLIYCDRDTNPSGGVRAGGYLINSRIETCLGTNTLYQQYALGIGELGFVDEDSTLFDEQPRRNFTLREIETYKRDGTELQTAMPEFPYYSQVITPPNYNVFGVDLRTTVTSIEPWTPGDSAEAVNVRVVGNRISKTGGVNGAYDAGLFSDESIDPTGFLQFTPNTVGDYSGGLSSANPDTDFISTEFGFRFKPNGFMDIVESGVVVVANLPYTAGATRVRLTVTATNQVQYFVDGGLVHTSSAAPTLPIFADFAFATVGSSVTNTFFNYTGGGGAVIPPGGALISVIGISEEEDDDTDGAYERMNPSDDYFLKKLPIGYTYYITDKDLATRTLTITPPVPLDDGDEIWARWVAKHETTKRVNQIHINLAFSLSAIDKEEGSNRVHGTLFDLYLSPVIDNIINLQFIRRFFVRGERSGTVRRGFNITNLPLGRYYFELRPLPCNPRTANAGQGLDLTGGFGIVYGSDPNVEDGFGECYGTACGFYSGNPDDRPNCPVVFPTSGVDTPEPERSTGVLFGDPIFPGGSVSFEVELDQNCGVEGDPGPDTIARMCMGVAPDTATYDPEAPLSSFDHHFCLESPTWNYPPVRNYETDGFPVNVNGRWGASDIWRFDWDGTTLFLYQNNVLVNSTPYNPGPSIKFGFTTPAERNDATPAMTGLCGNRLCISSFNGNEPIQIDPNNENIIVNATVTELTDSGECNRVINTGVTITSPQTNQALLVFIEGDVSGDPGDGEIDKALTYEGKTQVSSENGPTGKISSINEVVTLPAIGQNVGDNSYPNIALVAHKFLASNRLQSPPGHSVLIRRGRRIRNHISAGTVDAGSNNLTLLDTTANFLAQGVQVGMVVRNLTKRTEAQITAVTNNTITTVLGLNWEDKANVSCGDRYLVYFTDSSAYFPDIFCDLLQNPINCLGQYIDADRFIDYPSIVDSREFCATNGYFWDDVIESEVNFAQFVTSESKGSLLYPVKIDGRYGLTPERFIPPVAVFNGSNIENFSEEFIDWSQLLPNKMVVTFTDGRNEFKTDGARFRPQSVIIQTADSFNGLVPEVEVPLSLPAVTNEAQAIKVAQVYLQSLIHQDKQISFTTDLQALYFLAGDLIIVQTVNTEFSDELSGFVKSIVVPFDPLIGTQTVKLSNSPIIYRGKATSGGLDLLTDVTQDFTQMTFGVGDLLVKDQTLEYAVITGFTNNTITTSSGFQWVEHDTYSIEKATMTPATYKSSAMFRETGNVDDGLGVTSIISPEGEIQIRLSGLTEPLEILDPVVIGRNIQDEQLYRVTELAPSEDGKIKISATKWDRIVLTDEGLVTLTQANGI